jgi:hypothetical protein
MTLTPEIIAKLLFQISNLRWLEREYISDVDKDIEVSKAIVNAKIELDKTLSENYLDEHFDLSTLTEIIRLNLEATKLKKAV